MGFAASWVAVSGRTLDQVAEELGLVLTGKTEEGPKSPISGATLPNGWALIFAHEFGSRLVTEKTLQSLSNSGTVVSCQVEEHTMFSSSSCHSNGHEVWNVCHDAQQHMKHLSTRGSLPESFSVVRDELLRQQEAAGGEAADVDYVFDIPVALAESLTSFRHDQDIGVPQAAPFHVLSSTISSQPNNPWWKVW